MISKIVQYAIKKKTITITKKNNNTITITKNIVNF